MNLKNKVHSHCYHIVSTISSLYFLYQNNKTPLDVARSNNTVECVSLLENYMVRFLFVNQFEINLSFNSLTIQKSKQENIQIKEEKKASLQKDSEVIQTTNNNNNNNNKMIVSLTHRVEQLQAENVCKFYLKIFSTNFFV